MFTQAKSRRSWQTAEAVVATALYSSCMLAKQGRIGFVTPEHNLDPEVPGR